MSKQLLSRIFYGTFILIFLVMMGIMVVGFINQNKDEKAQNARYESMISDGSRTVLTDDILNEDYTKYVNDIAKSKNTFISLLICFAAAVVLFIVMYIFSIILKGMEEGAGSTMFIILLASFLVVMFMFGSFAVISIKFLAPRLSRTQPENEYYYFNELNIKDAEKEEKTEQVKNGDSYETRTTVYYYLIDENDKRISVNKILYSRFVGEGVYYAGQTAGGRIFSIYPEKYFQLP